MTDRQELVELGDSAATVLAAGEIARAEEIARRFDPRPSNAILQFGVAAQKRMGDLVTPILQKVRTKDAGPAGEALTTLMMRVKELGADSLARQAESILARLPLIGRAFSHIQRFLSRYERIAVKIDRIVEELKQARQTLLSDITQFDALYKENAADYRETLVHIRAGEIKLNELRSECAAAEARAARENSLTTSQEARDLGGLVTRLERRVHDLKLTAMIALQMAPQIRLVQSGDQTLVEKIQNSILTTIPLWKNQVVVAISLFNQRKALELQRAVTDTTNELLTSNARLLQQGVTGIARESERGIVELATLQEVNNQLISTIQETLQIQEEGRRKRREAEAELIGLQVQLKEALVQARQ
jgi:uncharacterized protein YaaN involved in tellurite resistance